MSSAALMDVALGNKPADLVVRGGRLVDVHTAQVYEADVAVKGDRIAAVGEVGYTIGPATDVLDASGRYVCPGFIDTHQHSYESHLNLTEYARVLLQHGTTAVAEAFYGMGFVSGLRGIRESLDELKRTPLKVLFMVPILAYLQNRELGLPVTPLCPTAEELLEMLEWPECRGLEEPPYIPILEKDPLFLELFERTVAAGKVVTGHGCGLAGLDLQAYVAAGASSDHEAVTAAQALARARLGMWISMREGSGASDVRQLVGALTERNIASRSFCFCGDEVEFLRLHRQGHLDYSLRLAVGAGLDPVKAIQAATINAAGLLGVERNLGSVAPGKAADIVVVDDLAGFRVFAVVAGGRPVWRDGRFLAPLERPAYPDWMRETVRVKRRPTLDDLRLRVPGNRRRVKVRVIGVTDGSLLSDERRLEVEVASGEVVQDTGRDLCKVAMVDRFGRFEGVGLGLIQGFGLKRGALGTSYNGLCQNLLVVGADDRDMLMALDRLAALGGGFVAVGGGQVLAELPLPLYGLLSDLPLEEAAVRMEGLYEAMDRLGCTLRKGPLHTLAFTGVCGEIGHLKVGHAGLFEVAAKSFVPVVVD